MVERFHHQLMAVLRTRYSGADWLEHLPWVLLDLCAAPKEEAGVLAAEAVYGHSLVLPSQLQPPPRAPQVAPAKVEIPSMVKPAREEEKVQEVGVQEASHMYDVRTHRSGHRSTRCLVPWPLLHADQGEEEAAPGDRCHAAVGLCGPSEAAHSGSRPSSVAAATTWTPAQNCYYIKLLVFVLSYE